jgi:hypothetical protein
MRRAILAALALIITFDFAAQASAKDATDLRGTTWVTASKDANGVTKLTMMIFNDEGKFILATDYKGELSRAVGTYSLYGSQISIKLDGEPFTMIVVTHDDELLVTTGGRSGNVAWIKYRK